MYLVHLKSETYEARVMLVNCATPYPIGYYDQRTNHVLHTFHLEFV